MGRKVHPIGFRLGINKPWLGRWYAEGEDYTDQLHQDLRIRELAMKDGERAGVSTLCRGGAAAGRPAHCRLRDRAGSDRQAA